VYNAKTKQKKQELLSQIENNSSRITLEKIVEVYRRRLTSKKLNMRRKKLIKK